MSKWNVDVTHTNVGFEIKHMMVSKVRGNFSDMEGTIEGDPRELENTKINFRVGIDSISTNNEDRDNHLRSADFFEAEKYPNMTFESTNIKKVGDNQYELTGNLTIKDVTKETTFDVEYLGEGTNPWGVEVVGFEASTTISRKEFGLTWNQALETGGVLVGDDVKIQIDLQVNPAS
ncbi:MAG TPA: YceI family protein [Pseudogracilibacillus sp.]|nr:YceI family protein [Pseudogracilibacillus sp.]